MKESRSRRDREICNRRVENEFRDPINESRGYRNVLKERCYKEPINEERASRRNKDGHSKHPSHSKRRSRSESPHHVRRNRHRSSPIKYRTESDDVKHKKHHHKTDATESYEELSRRKRRIESELHALDLEEAAEREAENKTHKKIPNSSKRRKIRNVQIKQEVVSGDDEEDKRLVSGDKQNKLSNDDQRSRHKHHASKSSEDEKSWGKPQAESKKVVKEKPNFSVSGKLAEDTNTFNGVVIKYNEPAEARKPRRKWRLYPFKGDSDLPFIPIHRQSAYLFGRSRLIADIPIDHPSCSKQHAILQFRLVAFKRDDGTTGKRVRPYILDLESSNGTFVNNKKIEPRCYVELMERDVVKFGYSTREYVLLHEESKDNFEDDDVIEPND